MKCEYPLAQAICDTIVRMPGSTRSKAVLLGIPDSTMHRLVNGSILFSVSSHKSHHSRKTNFFKSVEEKLVAAKIQICEGPTRRWMSPELRKHHTWFDNTPSQCHFRAQSFQGM